MRFERDHTIDNEWRRFNATIIETPIKIELRLSIRIHDSDGDLDPKGVVRLIIDGNRLSSYDITFNEAKDILIRNGLSLNEFNTLFKEDDDED